MKVKELIELLEKEDPNEIVMGRDEHYSYYEYVYAGPQEVCYVKKLGLHLHTEEFPKLKKIKVFTII